MTEVGSGVRRAATWGRPTMLRAYLTLLLLLVWVLTDIGPEDLFLLVGAAAVLVGVVELVFAALIHPRGRPPAVLRALGPVAAGVVLLVGSHDDMTSLLFAVGVLLGIRAVADAWAAATVGRDLGVSVWLVGLAGAELAGALVAVFLPQLFGPAVLVALGLSWIGAAALSPRAATGGTIPRMTLAPVPRRESMADSERARVVDDLLLGGGEDLRERLVRFVVLLGIATVIATYGVLGDNVAAVIGGMIVAPLMTPIQALTVALISGMPRRALGAAAVIVGGVVLVLTLAMVIALTYRDLSVELLGGEVVSRTSPTLPDLAVALAAGAAGGFALTRRDVAASLPGVAIAVSLVPPLCVSGASLAGDELGDALGAFLLFLVNFVAIVVATGATLVISGFGTTAGRGSRRLLTLTVAFGTALVVLAVPLAVSGLDTLVEQDLEGAVSDEVTAWLDPVEPAELLDLKVTGDEVDVLVTSAKQPPPVGPLEQRIGAAVGSTVSVTVHWVPSTVLE